MLTSSLQGGDHHKYLPASDIIADGQLETESLCCCHPHLHVCDPHCHHTDLPASDIIADDQPSSK